MGGQRFMQPTTYEIAKSMAMLAKGVKETPGEMANRCMDTVIWADDHLTEGEKNVIGQLARSLL
jgi:hypothetical protein